ncbi:MAG TPA: ATP-binding protein, partial [Dongiaceae bacterium]|nr:ATP-binding protein [Dongiaceae bacterium]
MDDTLIDQALAARPGLDSNNLPPRLVVGFSGGLDSTVLLHLVWRWQQRHPDADLLALHINHQLHPLASQWQQHCAAQCQ